MTKTSWVDRRSNIEVLKQVSEEREYIKKRNIKFLDHLIKHNSFVINILEGKSEKKKRGRARGTCLDDVIVVMGVEAHEELKKMAGEMNSWLCHQALVFRR